MGKDRRARMVNPTQLGAHTGEKFTPTLTPITKSQQVDKRIVLRGVTFRGWTLMGGGNHRNKEKGCSQKGEKGGNTAPRGIQFYMGVRHQNKKVGSEHRHSQRKMHSKVGSHKARAEERCKDF